MFCRFSPLLSLQTHPSEVEVVLDKSSAFFVEYSGDGFEWQPGEFFDVYFSAQREAREASRNGKFYRVWNVELNKLLITYRKGMSLPPKQKPEDLAWW